MGDDVVRGNDFVIRDGSRYFLGWLSVGSLVRALWTGDQEEAMRYTREEAWAEVERMPLVLRVVLDVEAVSR